MNENERKTKIIVFIGVSKYDLIAYSARILFKLSKKVLICDFTEDKELLHCIPEVMDIILREENSTDMEIIQCKGIFYLNYNYYNKYVFESLTDKLVHENIYDCLILNFGFNMTGHISNLCTTKVYVSDQMRNNLEKLKIQPGLSDENSICVIRDYLSCRIGLKSICRLLGKPYSSDLVFILEFCENDYKYRICNQYSTKLYFKYISRNMNSLLNRIITGLFKTVTKKEYKAACKSAGCGG